MGLIKKYKIESGLVFILVISIFFSFYSIINYKSTEFGGQRGSFTQNFKNNNDSNSNSTKKNTDTNSQGNPQMRKDVSNNGTNQWGNRQNNSSQNINRPQNNTNVNGNMPQGNMNNSNMPQGNVFRGVNSSNTTSGYSISLFTYGILFVGLSVLAYYLIKNKKVKVEVNNKKLVILSLFAIGFFLRIIFALKFQGFSSDLGLFKNWANAAANNFAGFYSNGSSSDYPPLFIYVLYLIGKIASIGNINSYYILLLKIPSIIADLVTAYVIYKLANKRFSNGISSLLALFYIFNPAIFIDSVFWGQVDSFFTMILVIAILNIAENKLYLSTIFFAMAVLMKPQGIIFAPVLFFELVRTKNIKKVILSIVIGLSTVILIILPFSLTQQPLWIIKLYQTTIGEYPYASVNAFNFFSLIKGNYVNDNNILLLFSYKIWGLIFIVINSAFSWFIYIKGNSKNYAFLSALILITGTFTFSTGMHERYLFPAVALAILSFIYLEDKLLLLISLGLSITSYLNIQAILFGNYGRDTYSDVLIVTSLLNIIIVICIYIFSYTRVNKRIKS